MFDFSWSEIAIIVIVALVFIRPADLPVALKTLSKGIKAVRKLASEFQGHVDEMVREADLGDVRDQFRDLKRFDFRDRVEKAIDSDGSLRREFSSPPSLSLPPPKALGINDTAREGGVEAASAMAEPVEAIEPPQTSAPSILPPTTAKRLERERERWYPPSILPPATVEHGGRRVRLGGNTKAASGHQMRS